MDAVLPLTIAVPVATAAVLAALGHFLRRAVADAIAVAAAAATTVLCAIVLHRSTTHQVVHWFGAWQPRRGVAVGVDFAAGPLAAGLALLAAALTTAALVFAARYFDAVRTLHHAVVLVFGAAMIGFALSGDLFDIFVFFELMSVAAYGLTAYKSEERGALQGALNFAVVNSVGAFLVLFGIALLYGRTGTLNLDQLGRALESHGSDGLVVVAMALVVGGFFVKAAIVPFHFWLADAHAVAPTPVCILFSGVMVELGIYAGARVYWTVFSGAIPPGAALRAVLIGAGVLTALIGAVLCVAQHHLKRMLALSTISHSGIALIGVGQLGATGLAGAGVYVLGHGLVKGALFACTGVLLHRLGAVDTHHLHGRAKRLRFIAVVWFAGGLALAGLPPFATYLGKGLIDEGSRELHATWLAVVVVAAAGATGLAVLRAGAQVFFGWGPVAEDATSEAQDGDEEQETRGSPGRTPVVMAGVAATLLAGALALGLAPHLAHGADRAAHRFVDRRASAAEVLDGAPATPPPATSPAPSPSPSMVVYGVAGAAFAVAGAALAIGRTRLPRSLRNGATRIGAPPLRALRAVHTGHVGDYVAWLVAGVALLGGLLAVAARPL